MEKKEIKEVYNLHWSDKFELEDIENRRLYLNTIVDEEVVTSLVYHILRYNRIDKDIDVKDRKPIILYINTPGGRVTDGYSLIDAICNSKTPIYTVNLATCYSMGFLIFLAGNKRFSFPNSTFLMHDGSSFAWDSTAKMKDRVDFEAGQVEIHTKDYILSHTKISEEKYEEKYRVEWYFYPEEAKENGITDFIVGKDCELDQIL